MGVAFYLMLGFGSHGHGFESTSCFGGDLGLSLQLCFFGEVVGLTPHSLEGCGFDSTSFWRGNFF